jgi:N-acyl-D-aspartate/D-glutamate deacylase
MLDLKITNGQIVDGTGAPRRGGDVGIRDGRIVALGQVDEAAAHTMDADGAVVAPGFIDIHTHYDAQVLWDPTLAPSTLHGVTSVVAGNCGFSVAPLTDEGASYLMRMLARVEGMPLESLETALDWGWRSTSDYFGRVEKALGPNVGFMVGHTAVRRAVMGPAAKERAADETEIEAMKELLRQGLAAGGLGLSSSLADSHKDAEGDPVPSRHASADELLALASVCGSFPGTCLEMVPHVGPGAFPEAKADLMIELTSRSGRPLNWNILHANASNGEEVEARLAVSDRARQAGGKIVGLFMPMPIQIRLNFLSGMVLDMLPGWDKIMALPPAEKMAMFRSGSGRTRMRELAEQRPARWSNWGAYELYETFSSANEKYTGRQVADIAAEEDRDPYDVLLDVALEDELRTSFGFPAAGDTTADWEARGRLLRDRRVVVGASDAGAHLDMVDTFRYTTDMLEQCVRRHGLLSTEDAVHLLTEVPAALHGLRDRGVLRQGAWADVVVFDEDTVGSGEVKARGDLPGGGSRLYAEADGVMAVLVNGRPLVERGEVTEQRPGTLIRSGRDTDTPSLVG